MRRARSGDPGEGWQVEWLVGRAGGWAVLLMDAWPVARVHCQGGE